MRQANEHGQSLLTKEGEELIYWKAQTTLAFDWTIFPAYSSSSAHYQKAMLLTAGFRESVFSVLTPGSEVCHSQPLHTAPCKVIEVLDCPPSNTHTLVRERALQHLIFIDGCSTELVGEIACKHPLCQRLRN